MGRRGPAATGPPNRQTAPPLIPDNQIVRRPDTRAALDLYDELAGVDDSGAGPSQPRSLVLVHALLRPTSEPMLGQWERFASTYPVVLDAAEQQRAACGLRIKVLLPYGFDDQDEDACERCQTEVTRWALNPDAWWQEQRRWEQRKRARPDLSEDVAVWRALEDRRRSRAQGRRQPPVN